MRTTRLSRRAALGGLTASALAVPAGAAAVLGLDIQLIALGREFDAAMAVAEELCSAAQRRDENPAYFGTPAYNRDCEEVYAAFDAADSIVEKITPLPVHTIDGLRVKAKAFLRAHYSYADPSDWDPDDREGLRLGKQIIDFLLGDERKKYWNG